jgi:HK97 family phage portal protein
MRLLDESAIPSPGSLFANFTGINVNQDQALRLAAVWACVQKIGNALSTTPIDAYRRTPERRIPVEPSPHILVDPWPEMLQIEWMFTMIASLLLQGNAYGYKDGFDRLGYPTMVMPVPAEQVYVDRTDAGVLRYRFNGELVPLERVFHMRAFSVPGMDEGLSPIRYFAQTFGLGLASERFGAQWFNDGGHPHGLLSADGTVTEEQANALKDRWRRAMQESRSVAVVGGGLKYAPIQIAPSESQFLETQKFSVNQIARIFDVPPTMIGAATEGSSVTYANVESNQIDFQQNTLMPWAIRLEMALNKLLPRGQFVKFNMDAALRVETKERYHTHAIGLRDRWLTIPEVREIEDLPPLNNDEMFPGDAQSPLTPPPVPSPQSGDVQ